MYACVCVPVPSQAGRISQNPGAEVIVRCELPYGKCWEVDSGALEEQQVLSTTELSLIP